MTMRILSVGTFEKLSNTCLHRHWALKKVADKVDEVDVSGRGHSTLWYRIAWHLFYYGLPVPIPEGNGENVRIREMVDANEYDVVWIDKGVTIKPSTLRYIKAKQPKCKIIGYDIDNMTLRHNQSQQFLGCVPLYDAHVIPYRPMYYENLMKLGAKEVCVVDWSYCPEFHYPRMLTEEERERLGGDVGFIGAWEKERCESILFLAKNGVKVKVFGDGRWNDYKGTPNLTILPSVFNEDYSKALQAFKISLGFLRKMNNDQYTTRSMEIPACGGFMLAERTDEHLRLFEEGKEAVFFSSDEELLDKCRYYTLPTMTSARR